MQIISTIPLYNYNVPVITTKKTSHSVLVNHRKTFSRTYKQNSRTFQDRKKNPGLFQDVATLMVSTTSEHYFPPYASKF